MLNWVLNKVIGSQNERIVKRLTPVVEQVNAVEPAMKGLSDAALQEKASELRQRLKSRIEELGGGLLPDGSVPLGEMDPADEDAIKAERKRRLKIEAQALEEILPETFALVREAGRRRVSMRHFDVQLIGGVVLHQGTIAEMATGEGKTLVATLPVVLNAFLGRGVHLVTVNDYLAKRDRNWMGPIYESLGLSVGVIQHDMASDERRAAYGCDVTYGTNNEFGFDYLRDNMAVDVTECVQRRLSYAIVDEVDSILIDEARTPLIISGPAEESAELYYQIDRIIPKLTRGTDYTIDEKAHSAVLTEDGVKKAEGLLNVGNLYEDTNITLVHHINQALRAHTLYKRDVDYMIKEGQVVIVDEFTGRLMPWRRWSDGLHQAIEAKEGVKIERENQTLATITFQNYFRMYDKLAGMTGTASTEAAEFHQIYHLEVVTIPTNCTLIRTNYQDVVYRSETEKFLAIVEEIVELHTAGRPVLVGTVSIEKSERLSQLLKQPAPVADWLERQRRQILKELEAGTWKIADPSFQSDCARLLKGSGTLGHEQVSTLAERLKKLDPKSSLLYPLEKLSRTALALGHIREGISHHVLNARYHEQEAQIVAQAGRYKGVTIATNMAGRGTDILLGGNPQFLFQEELKRRQQISSGGKEASPQELPPDVQDEISKSIQAQVEKEHEQVVAVGGLHVLGTERHESRRIDNQLRGRAGRQGDPGSSRFYVSLEDDLIRIFGEENRLLEWTKAAMPEGEAMEYGMLSRAIETAQKRVELHNFEIRKRLLEYDNVMNRQREVIYKERRSVLEGQDLKPKILEMLDELVEGLLSVYAPEHQDPEEWDVKALWESMQSQFGITTPLEEKSRQGKEELADQLLEAAHEAYETREQVLGADQMRRLERWVMLQVIDSKWKDHLYGMDHLREGISYRVYGQQDPLVEYQHEAYEMFTRMVESVRAEVVDLIFRIQPVHADRVARVLAPTQFLHPEAPHPAVGSPQPIDSAPRPYESGGAAEEPFLRPFEPGPQAAQEASATVRRDHPKIGRNDPCYCGSGKKFKKCHGS